MSTDGRYVSTENIMGLICDLAQMVHRRGEERLAQGLLLAVALQSELGDLPGKADRPLAVPTATPEPRAALTPVGSAEAERSFALQALRLKVEEVELQVRLRKARDEIKQYRNAEGAKG